MTATENTSPKPATPHTSPLDRIVKELWSGGRYYIDLSDERKADLLELLRRGLNTWEPPPAWLVQLYDELMP